MKRCTTSDQGNLHAPGIAAAWTRLFQVPLAGSAADFAEEYYGGPDGEDRVNRHMDDLVRRTLDGLGR